MSRPVWKDPQSPELKARRWEILDSLMHVGLEWARPMDIGGFDSSHHSRDLRQMCKWGMVDKTQRFGRHWRYRISPYGQVTWALWKKELETLATEDER